ncbi:hypothetical protein C6P40_004208 [Pichia californica]|uniref:C2H2-type domain-containing protein n=1 Tax=Pichia californica TaxID=460514 RepID=A0A9P6WGA4_9ASCO|nr:hypothetical protein C6P40_004208 [[Candida] californica]
MCSFIQPTHSTSRTTQEQPYKQKLKEDYLMLKRKPSFYIASSPESLSAPETPFISDNLISLSKNYSYSYQNLNSINSSSILTLNQYNTSSEINIQLGYNKSRHNSEVLYSKISNHLSLNDLAYLSVFKPDKLNFGNEINITREDPQTIIKTNQNYDKLLTLDDPTTLLILDTSTYAKPINQNNYQYKEPYNKNIPNDNIQDVDNHHNLVCNHYHYHHHHDQQYNHQNRHPQNYSHTQYNNTINKEVLNMELDLESDIDLEDNEIDKKKSFKLLSKNAIKKEKETYESVSNPIANFTSDIPNKSYVGSEFINNIPKSFTKESKFKIRNNNINTSIKKINNSIMTNNITTNNIMTNNIITIVNKNNSINKINKENMKKPLVYTKTKFKIIEMKKKHTCTTCNQSFHSSSNLTSHIRCHLEEEKQICCQFCDKKFKRRNDLERHKFTHHLKLKLFCNGFVDGNEWGCGMQYSRRDALIKHWNGRGKKCIHKFKQLRGLPEKMDIKEVRVFALNNITQIQEC